MKYRLAFLRCLSLCVLASFFFVPALADPVAAPAPLTLPSAVAAALTVNPAARAATQQLVQTQARVLQAQAGRRLQITFNSTVSGSDADVYQPPPSHEMFGTLQNTLTVPLPVGSRPRLAVEQAQAQLDAALAQFQSARLALVSQVSAAYFDVLRRQALLLGAQDDEAQAARALDDARRRNQAGDVPALDVLRAQVPLASAQAVRYQAASQLDIARQTLNGLVGQPLDASVTVVDVQPDANPLPPTLDQARTRALVSSADLQAAQATVRADLAALQAARRYADPTLSLQAIDIRSKDVTSFSREDTLQAAVTIPLSDGGLGRAQVREAQAALAQAQAQVETVRQTVLVAVSAAYLTVQSIRRQVTAAQTARDIAQLSYDKTVLGYQNGLYPLSDVLNAQTALTQARTAYTQAVYDSEVALNSLNALLTGAGTGAAVPPSPPGAADTGGNSTTGVSPNGTNAGGRGGP